MKTPLRSIIITLVLLLGLSGGHLWGQNCGNCPSSTRPETRPPSPSVPDASRTVTEKQSELAQSKEREKAAKSPPSKDDPSVFDGPMQEGADKAREVPKALEAAKKQLALATREKKKKLKEVFKNDPKVKQLVGQRDALDAERVKQASHLRDTPESDTVEHQKAEKDLKGTEDKLKQNKTDLDQAKKDAEKAWNDTKEGKAANEKVDEAAKDYKALQGEQDKASKAGGYSDMQKLTTPDNEQQKVDENDLKGGGDSGGSSAPVPKGK